MEGRFFALIPPFSQRITNIWQTKSILCSFCWGENGVKPVFLQNPDHDPTPKKRGKDQR